MRNINQPCSVELQLLSSLKHEKVSIESRIIRGDCPSTDMMIVVLDYMKTRIQEIEDRL